MGKTLATDATLALLSSVITVLGAVALAAIVFSGPAAEAVPLGFLMVLSGSVVAGAVVAVTSRFPCNISGAQDQPAAILGAIAAGFGAVPFASTEAAVSTLIAIVILSTLVFGVALVLLGSFRLGKLAQLIPYPVVGGFLAGVGLLVMAATLRFLTGRDVQLASIPAYLGGIDALRWLPAFAVAVLAYAGMGRIRHVLFLPGVLAAFVAGFHLVAALAGVSLERLRAEGWLFAAFPEGGVIEALSRLNPGLVDLGVVIGAAEEIGALVLVCIIGASLAITALEIGAERELEPNHEIRAQGLSNLAAALVGGIPSFTLTAPSLAYHRMGASTRWMPLLRSAFSLALGLAGIQALAYMPKMMVGALLFLFSFGFLIEWLLVARRRMESTDYALVLIITGIITLVGFLEGIGAGILIAAVFFLVKYSRIGVIKAEFSGRDYRSDVERPFRDNAILDHYGDRLVVFELQGYVFFGSAASLLDRIRERIGVERRTVQYVVLGFRQVSGLDASANFALKKLQMFAQANGILLLFSHLTDAQTAHLCAAGVLQADALDRQRFPDTAFAVEWVEDRLLAGHGQPAGEVTIAGLLADMLGDRAGAAALLPHLQRRELAAGEVLFRQGDADDGIFVLVDGHLSAMMHLDGRGAMRVRKFSPGSVIGEMSFYGDGHRSASLIADTAAIVYEMRGPDLAALAARAPVVAAAFHQMIARLMAQRLVAMNGIVRNLV